MCKTKFRFLRKRVEFKISLYVLFFIVRHIFDEHIAILYVLLFPGSIIGIKWISVCGLSVIMLLHIYKKANVKSYIGFWIATLVGAFYTYDEGISLGVACILAYLIYYTGFLFKCQL